MSSTLSGNQLTVASIDNATGVSVEYNGTEKLSTTSTGIDVTGTTVTDNLTVSGTTTLAGATTSADINFGDNDKAIFGAGSDLQIYHDGSNSYIADAGTGNLNLVSNGTQINLQKSDGTKLIEAINNGNVVLYSNGAEKVRTNGTGVDVTGTVTADGIALGTSNTLAWGSNAYINAYGGSAQAVRIHTDPSDLSGSGFFEVVDGAGAAKKLLVSDSGDISFYEDTGTTAKFFWDASAESLGIGTSSPANPLHISNASPSILLQDNNGAGTAATGFIDFVDSAASRLGYIGYASGSNSDLDINQTQSANIDFSTNNTFAMRIDSSGNLLVGTTTAPNSTNNGGAAFFVDSYSRRNLLLAHTNSGVRSLVRFFGNGNTTDSGYIACDGTSTSYNTSSDYRLKEDWHPMQASLERVKALKPVNFAWKSSGVRVDGFLAHELQEVIPEAVVGTKDAVKVWEEDEELPEGVAAGDNKLDDDGNTIPDYQGIDQSKLVPLLTAALQEAIAKIESLEARLDAANL